MEIKKRIVTKCLALLCTCLCVTNRVTAQSAVSVNPLTGTANVTIPIYTLQNGQVTVPVSISYSATGVKTRDVEQTAGMGWQLQAGGSITRLVRGLPDDVTKDNSSNARYGWMSSSNTAAGYAGTFAIQNNGSTCSYETNDITNINTNIPFNYDTEPDMFYVNAPGLSCQLVYSRDSSKFMPVTYQDLKIAYTVRGGTGINAPTITQFSITNDKGITYVFASADTVVQTTALGSLGAGTYLATQYKQYQYGITYSDNWSLVSVTDANGNSIRCSYHSAPARGSNDPVSLYFWNGTTNTSALQYYVYQQVTPFVLDSIYSATPVTSVLRFTWRTFSGAGNSGQTTVTEISGCGRDLRFNYSPVDYTPTGFYREFLRTLTDEGCNSPINYQFGYLGETLSGGIYTTTLPDSTSNQVDYWGYYSSSASTSTLLPSVYVLNPVISYYPRYVIDVNGAPGSAYMYSLLAANNRAATPATVATGTLNKITYASGGNSNIVYQSNDYYDVPSATTMQGGGIRVSQVIDSVGSGATNNMVRNYSYVIPGGTVSSGKPLTLPQFAFTIPYSGSATGQSLWAYATALSAYDLSNDDHTIMYSYVKVSQTDAGSTMYTFTLPGTYWDTSAGPVCTGCAGGEWAPTIEYSGRYNCSLTYGPLVNGANSYPFIPNPNYDFERGLPAQVVNYNDAGNEISETDYTYVRSFSPFVINAFKYDNNGPTGLVAMGYNRYKVFYNTSELTATVISKVFDSGTHALSQSDTTIYAYNSPYHKLLTQVTKTNSDRNVVNSYFHYVKDYSLAMGSNANINALYNLRQLNINAPVETYRQVTHAGPTLTTSASLTFFNTFSGGGSANLYLPSKSYKMVLPDGTGSFSPMTISGSTLTWDMAQYNITANYAMYDHSGYLLTADDGHQKVQTTVTDHTSNQPIAVFANARYNEAAYQDFDSNISSPFTTFYVNSETAPAAVGSHAGKAQGVYSGTSVSTPTNLAKNMIAANYIFSVWVNGASAGTLSLSITGISTAITQGYSAGWNYYEVKVPAASITSSYTVSFTCNTNITVDDILFYPDVAEATTATYDPITRFKIAATNTNGVSSYFTSDQWGRPLLQFDQDKNIVLKHSYFTPADAAAFASPATIGYSPASPNLGGPVSFTLPPIAACSAVGLKYKWTFGDGSTAITTTNTASHQYANSGTYSVSVTVSSPFFGSKTVALSLPVAGVPIVYTNSTTGANLVSASFYIGTTLYHTYTAADLSAGTATVPAGTYNIVLNTSGVVYPTHSTGYKYAAVGEGTTGFCIAATSGTPTPPTSQPVTAGGTLNIIMTTGACPYD